MSIVTFGSVRGAPGVTTTALLVAGGIEGAALLEADLAGGVLAIRYGLGREPGLTTLAAARPGEPDGWREHAQSAGGVPVLVGPDDPDSCEMLWRGAGDRLATILRGTDAAVTVADAGRLGAASPLLAASDLIVIVVRPIAEHLIALSHRLARLRRDTDARLAVVPVGEGPYKVDDLGSALDVDVLGGLPNDPRAAAVLLGGGRSQAGLARTRLARAATGLSADIERLLHETTSRLGVGR
jgi:hypothetical protein